MRPVLFQWRGFTVPSYPAMLYIGLVAGVVAGDAAANAAGINAFRAFMATLILVVPALVGARLLYVVGHWPIYRHRLRRIWSRGEGGAAMYGGLFVALPISIPLLRALRIPIGAFWDVCAFTILLGMIFTRMGCLMNGCCAGRRSKLWFALYLPDRMGVWDRRIPTQCLEAGWAAVLLVCAMIVWGWLPFSGGLFLLTTTSYASGRIVLEFTREPERGDTGRLTINHASSAVLIVLSVATLAICWPK